MGEHLRELSFNKSQLLSVISRDVKSGRIIFVICIYMRLAKLNSIQGLLAVAVGEQTLSVSSCS